MNPLSENQLDYLLAKAKHDQRVPSDELFKSALSKYQTQFTRRPQGPRIAFRTSTPAVALITALILVVGVFLGRVSWTTSSHSSKAPTLTVKETGSCASQGAGPVMPPTGLGFAELIPAKEITPYIVRGQKYAKQ